MVKYDNKYWLMGFKKWLIDNPGKDINDIKGSDEVILDDGTILKIGIKLSNLRKTFETIDPIFLNLGIKKNSNNSKISHS